MEKSINYIARDFEGIKSELIGFSEKYYPEISNNFNDNSVGSWFIDLVSAVGDDLNYYIDRCYQENNVNSANLMSSVLNTARMNNVKVPGSKASICEVKFSCVLPLLNADNISQPDWNYAPTIKIGSVIGNTTHQFEVLEDVNFAEQFNSDGISNRTFTPNKNANGVITGYTVTKSVIATAGTSRIYKKVLTEDDIEPFMEVVLPERNIMNIESILFKESSNFKYNPNNYEFYVDEEEFMVQGESVSTYRFFEVDSLSDQYRFSTETKYSTNSNGDLYIAADGNSQVYEDYTETTENGGASVRTSRYFKGKWKPITQKFISEFTDNGYTRIIFGGATTAQKMSSGQTNYAEYISSKIVNNQMLGILPKGGWTMYVLYRIGGGVSTNVAPNSITSLINIRSEFYSTEATDVNVRNNVIKTLKVTNTSPSMCGKDAPSVEEVKYLTKYTINSNNRCVTLKDYKSKVLNMPPKYGCPFRCNAIEENNKIVISTLGIRADGTLDSALPQTLADNMVEYLTHFKSINDYVAIRSGKVYNLGFEADVFIDKNYTTSDVILTIINKISDYMSVNNHDMGEEIFIGDLERELNSLDGVISLIELRVYNIWGGRYSKDKSPLPEEVTYENGCVAVRDSAFSNGEINSFRISLKETDSLLSSDYDSMYEILNPSSDIRVRCKLK